MSAAITNRSQARDYLKGHWKSAILVQTIFIGAEIFLILSEGLCLYRFNEISLIPFALLADLLLMSPLKAGRALFFQTIITDTEPATSKLLWRFFRQGYVRSVEWRCCLWLKRFSLHILFCIPSCFFLYASRIAEENGLQTFAMIAFAFSLIFLASAFIATEIFMLRYIPSVYLLKQVVTGKHAICLSKRLSKGWVTKWSTLYLDYAGWCFSLIFAFPFFYVSPLFHTARAATANRLFLSNSHRMREQHLQRGKNHGRIKNKF